MERYNPIAARVAQQREAIMTDADNGMDDDLPPEDRPNRCRNLSLPEAQRAVVFGSRLKLDDDVLLADGTVCRIVAPGRLAAWFTGWSMPATGGILLGTYEGTQVVDRAPADPEEDPHPIYPPEEPPPEEPG